VQVSAGTGTYFVKAVNTLGVASVNATYVIGQASTAGMTVVESVEQSPTWAGNLTNCTVISGLLVATDVTTQSMTYEFESSDYGAPFACNITLGLIVAAQLSGRSVGLYDVSTYDSGSVYL
jgi:hypothetical protein